jgi:hypothetical protein
MTQVEQLLRPSIITFGIEPLTTPDARWCFDQFFELNRRFVAGFDPRMSRSAHPEELTPPSGLLILGHLQGRPVGCGALKFHKKEPLTNADDTIVTRTAVHPRLKWELRLIGLVEFVADRDDHHLAVRRR